MIFDWTYFGLTLSCIALGIKLGKIDKRLSMIEKGLTKILKYEVAVMENILKTIKDIDGNTTTRDTTEGS